MHALWRNYGVYYSVMTYTGLWPYHQSILPTVQRICYSICILSCIAIQVFLIMNVDITLKRLLQMLSYSFPLLAYAVRYLGFIVNFPTVRSVMDKMQNDYDTLKDPNEAEILMRHVEQSKRVVYIFLGFSLLAPTILQSKYQLYALQLLGFFMSERGIQSDCLCVYLTCASTIGCLTLACTEASLAVMSFYLCGLLKITSYRIRTAVDNVVMSPCPKPIVLHSSVEIHQSALKTAVEMAENLTLSYLVAIMVVIVSFAVNLYCLCLGVLEMDAFGNVFISFELVIVHAIIMFLSNYSGQILINANHQLFIETYNSLWYRVPLEAQKMLLFILMRSSIDLQFSLSGLFVPCYEGFTMMMSSSFSYFTVIYSMQ
ncbi:uncharacterized protein LOC143174884 isoform X2 [Nomia melanderi]|uniref:uncharacterized protein LOC143174882 isoform X2 n=1 Tax=Nomia melanderi TaxID=2448451 RepID=UPI003FCC50E5